MEVVKYIRFEENGGEINLYFKICERLAEFVRKKTNLCEKALNLYLDKDNLFCYTISRTDNFEDIRQSLVETIERISNESGGLHISSSSLGGCFLIKRTNSLIPMMRLE